MSELSFKYLEIDTSKGLKDAEYKIEGKGIIILSSPAEAYIKLNSKLADPIPAITIEKIYADIEKIYVTTPPDPANLKLIILQSEGDFVDANTNWDLASATARFLSLMLLSSAQRGNRMEVITLEPASSPVVVQDLYFYGPYLIDNLIGFTILSGTPAGWTLTARSLNPGTGQEMTSSLDLSTLSEGDTVNLIAHSYVFTASESASSLTIAVDYLYIPFWAR